jgi:hypothetical protein
MDIFAVASKSCHIYLYTPDFLVLTDSFDAVIGVLRLTWSPDRADMAGGGDIRLHVESARFHSEGKGSDEGI